MSTNILDLANDFILKNARLLERYLFAFLFKQGRQQSVLEALHVYQNADGGFGNALEPDKRTASSQPIDQEIALRVMDDAGFDAGMARRMCDFLTTITTPEGGIPNVLPTVRDAPRAPWWDTENNHPPASINPTASIAGLLYKHQFQHPWLDQASTYCWRFIENLKDDQDHNLLCVLLFLENAADRARAAKEFKRLTPVILQHVVFDVANPGYVKKPLDWAPTPTSLCHSLFTDQTIDLHLAELMAKQQPDGAWSINWPAVSPASVLENQVMFIIQNMKTLKAYGCL